VLSAPPPTPQHKLREDAGRIWCCGDMASASNQEYSGFEDCEPFHEDANDFFC